MFVTLRRGIPNSEHKLTDLPSSSNVSIPLTSTERKSKKGRRLGGGGGEGNSHRWWHRQPRSTRERCRANRAWRGRATVPSEKRTRRAEEPGVNTRGGIKRRIREMGGMNPGDAQVELPVGLLDGLPRQVVLDVGAVRVDLRGGRSQLLHGRAGEDQRHSHLSQHGRPTTMN